MASRPYLVLRCHQPLVALDVLICYFTHGFTEEDITFLKYFTVTWPIITIFICTLSDKGFEPGTTNEQPNAVLSLPNMIVHILVVSMVGLRRPHRCCCSCGGCCGRLFSCRRSRPMARFVDAWIWAAIFL